MWWGVLGCWILRRVGGDYGLGLRGEGVLRDMVEGETIGG